MPKFIRARGLFLLILALAIFFRFWQITHLPGGLFPDEAANGLDVNSILSGHWQPFYERGNGREALFFYFLALSVSLFGRGPWQHHIVSATFGILTLIVTYLLVQRIFGRKIALLSSFLLAVSSYAVTLNRTAFRANTVPLFSTLTIYFLVCFFESNNNKQKLWYSALSGLSFGLGFYTYISFRMIVPLLLLFAIILLVSQRGKLTKLFQDYWRFKLAFVGAFFAAFSWIGYYFITHPGTFVGRAGQVSIFSPALNHGDVVGTFLSVLKLTILSFFTAGDLNWRHNVSTFPFLSPFISPFFALALMVLTLTSFKLLREAWNKKLNRSTVYQSLVALWFWLMLVPEISTAEGIPHGLRLAGVIPPIFILSAWGIDWVWHKIFNNIFLKSAKYLIAFIFLSSTFIYNYYAYFVIAAGSSDYYYAFRSDLTTVSNYLSKRNQKATTYLSLDAFSGQTVEYLTTKKGRPYMLVVPENTYQLQLKKADQVIFTQSTIFDAKKFKEFHPKAKLTKQEKNQFGQIIMQVYEES